MSFSEVKWPFQAIQTNDASLKRTHEILRTLNAKLLVLKSTRNVLITVS